MVLERLVAFDGNLDGSPDNRRQPVADGGSHKHAIIPTWTTVSNQWQPDTLKLKIRCRESGVGFESPLAYHLTPY
jgi:hypothetical protein